MGYICGKEKAPIEIGLKMVKEIWDALLTTFFDGIDEVQVFTLNQKAFATKQNGKSLTNYFGELIAIFQGLDHRDTVVMSFDRDIKAHAKSIERLRVYILLAGFDVEFDQVRGEILRKDPILRFRESYAYVRCEADIREAMKNEVAQYNKSRPFVTKTKDDSKYVAEQCLKLYCDFMAFFSVFMDIRTCRTIGYGVRRGKHYYLDLTSENSG
ncbi:hypothetical protein ACE6H2_007252 [Prunus campanulata]